MKILLQPRRFLNLRLLPQILIYHLNKNRQHLGALLNAVCLVQFPTNDAIIQKTRKQTGAKNAFRSLKVSWYTDFPWLHLCTTRNKLFCHYCWMTFEDGKLTLSKNVEPAFSKVGFDNWKKARAQFRSHEKSDGHREFLFNYFRGSGKQYGLQNDYYKERLLNVNKLHLNNNGPRYNHC